MQSITRRLIGFVVGLVALISALPASAQGNAQIRFAHFIPNASAVDVFINNTLVIEDLSFGNASTYLSVPAGEHSVVVTPTGIYTTALWQQSISASADRATTFIAANAESLGFVSYDDNLAALAFGNARWAVYHAIAGAPDVEIALAEEVSVNGVAQPAGTVIGTVGFGGALGAFDLPAQNYTVNVNAGGSTLVSDLSLNFSAGTSSIGIIYGTPNRPQFKVLSAATQGTAESGFVRFIHAAPSAPAVDVFVNDTLLIPALASATASEHIALPVGNHSVVVRVSGESTEVLSGDLTVNAGAAQSIVVRPDGDTLIGTQVNDDLSALSNTVALATITNAYAETTLLTAEAGAESLASDLEAGASSSTLAFSPVESEVSVVLEVAGSEFRFNSAPTTLYGGVYYNVVVVAGVGPIPPSVLVLPTGLAQSLNSAPNSTSAVLAVASGSTGTGATGETSNPVVISPATPEPAAPTPAPAQPVVTNAIDAEFSGRIVLDPGANLQLRQYPSADALSLGLAPSGASLVINGREGAPVALVEGQAPPPEAADWVDPVTLIAGDADLVPAETWLNVTYATPDGGSITAWVNSQFLDVRNRKGERQRLAELPTVGGNIPGSAQNTAISSPPLPEFSVTVTVGGLAAGTNLNVRRLPDTTSEVLASLPNGTIASFVGNSEDDQWVYLEYTSPEGGTVTGWASTLFLSYQLNGANIRLDDLKVAIDRTTREPLFAVVPLETAGSVRGNVTVVSVATANPLKDQFVATVALDANANLQLRRLPDSTSQSLALIPSGTQVIVTARTEAADWLKVSYEGQEGWVNTQFVQLSFNGNRVDAAGIAVDLTLEPASGG